MSETPPTSMIEAFAALHEAILDLGRQVWQPIERSVVLVLGALSSMVS